MHPDVPENRGARALNAEMIAGPFAVFYRGETPPDGANPAKMKQN